MEEIIIMVNDINNYNDNNNDNNYNDKLGWAAPHSSSKFSLSSKWTQMFWVQQILGKQRFRAHKDFAIFDIFQTPSL